MYGDFITDSEMLLCEVISQAPVLYPENAQLFQMAGGDNTLLFLSDESRVCAASTSQMTGACADNLLRTVNSATAMENNMSLDTASSDTCNSEPHKGLKKNVVVRSIMAMTDKLDQELERSKVAKRRESFKNWQAGLTKKQKSNSRRSEPLSLISEIIGRKQRSLQDDRTSCIINDISDSTFDNVWLKKMQRLPVPEQLTKARSSTEGKTDLYLNSVKPVALADMPEHGWNNSWLNCRHCALYSLLRRDRYIVAADKLAAIQEHEGFFSASDALQPGEELEKIDDLENRARRNNDRNS
ncbi:uncharacterized protein [Pyxicephalus adspersus]|uniref:uncharacterized protein n=1 Tax=Pyxicephalus adspersus TaxID=30357 RepID=UPI003B5A5FF5